MNPAKVKSLTKTFKAVPGAVWRWLVSHLSPRAHAVWSWLQSHVEGWRFDVAQIAEAAGVTCATIYNALTELEKARCLQRSDEVWTLVLPASTDDPPSQIHLTPRDQEGRAPGRARSPSEKNQPSNARSTEIETQSTPQPQHEQAGPSVSTTQKNETTQRPSQTPDPAGREEVPEQQRMKPTKFVDVWGVEFPRQGPASSPVLSPRWQQRVHWVWRYWTREEIAMAFSRTLEHCSTSAAWGYFCACLEAIARGDWHEDGPPKKKRGQPEAPSGWDEWAPWWSVTAEQYAFLASTTYATHPRERDRIEELWRTYVEYFPDRIPDELRRST